MINQKTTLDSINEVMIYGYSIAGLEVIKNLAYEKMEKVYDHRSPSQRINTLSGRKFIKMPSPIDSKNECKNTLVAVIIENFLREKEQFPIIPVIFCLTSTDTPHRLPTAWIANKELAKSPHGFISNSEIRRMYKLCEDPELPLEIRETAKKTFKFIHVTIPLFRKIHIRPTFEEIPPPWQNNEQTSIWIESQKLKKRNKIKSNDDCNKLNWKNLLITPSTAQKEVNLHSQNKKTQSCSIS